MPEGSMALDAKQDPACSPPDAVADVLTRHKKIQQEIKKGGDCPDSSRNLFKETIFIGTTAINFYNISKCPGFPYVFRNVF
jgi:hypothetical protein